MSQSFLSKTFGGLNLPYYLRHFVFGAVICALYIFMEYSATQRVEGRSLHYDILALFIVSTFLYPYSRFVYESIVNFIFGDNIFIVNAVVLIVLKIFTMILCWGFAIFIAPIGLAYLYYYHTKNEKNLSVSIDEQE